VTNFVRDVVAARGADDLAVVTIGGEGERREWTFGELLEASGSLAARYAEHGVRRGDVVLTLVGNRIEYVLAILAGLRIGAATLPCSEQLRAKDLALRLRRARPALVLCDARNRTELDAATPTCPVLTLPSAALLLGGTPPPYAELDDLDPAFVLFTSGTSGEPKMVTHGHRYIRGQTLQAREWLAAEPGELVWSTASPGWSKSARNSFIAPWLCGAAALLQDERFSVASRLATIRAERVNVLCMAPTEYRLIAAGGPIGALPSLRRAVTAGEALGVPAYVAWQSQTGLAISDGYGQTETGQVTGVRPARPRRPARWAGRCPASRWRSRTANWSSTRRPSRRSWSATTAAPYLRVCGTPATRCGRTPTAGCTSRRARTT
jgi:Acyl-coenzyme A synthetases/AMP-(fatty) acid ligases